MKHRFGFVIAVGVGLWGQASALAQQPVQPSPPASPPAAPPSDKPTARPAAPPAAPPVVPTDKPAEAAPTPDDSVGDQTDLTPVPEAKAAEPTPNAPPAPPAPGASTTPPAPPPITLPPYLTGGTSPFTILPPITPPPAIVVVPPPGPGADAGTLPTKKRSAYLKWRGTGVTWNHSVAATALGLGSDYLSSDNQQYVQTVTGVFNYFLIEPGRDEEGHKIGHQLRVQTSLGFDVELTNSDTTTDKYEKQLRDMPISFVLTKYLWRQGNLTEVALNLNGTFILPTSPVSRGEGVYLGVNPRAALFANLPLRGEKANFLQSVFIGVGGQYTHRFSEAETPTNSNLRRLRQTTTGSLSVSDQLTGRSLDSNNLRASAFAFFTEKVLGGDLWTTVSVGATYQFVNTFQSPANGCDVVIATGCTTAQRVDDPLNARVITDFGLSVAYFPTADWGITIGYDNAAGQLGPDGKWRNPFNSPNAQFNASLTVSVDSIVERIQGSIRDEPVIYFGQNKKRPAIPQDRMMQAIF